VAGQLDTGGLERLLVEFARHGDRSRFELEFVSLGARGTVAAEIEACGWKVLAMGEPRGCRPGLVVRLTELFRRSRFDIVHVHNIRPLLYAGTAARLAGAPGVVQTRHGRQSGFRLAARLADVVVGVSEDSVRLARQGGVAARTIRNGIDLGRFGYAGPSAGGPAVAVGRLSAEKDPETLVRAAAIACAADASFRVEIAGDGVCRAALERLVGELGLSGRVRLLGEVRDVAGLLGRASQFVLPSRTEGISLGLLEAMARGLPAVATRVGGTPEVVEEGVTGFLVPAAAPEALAAAMLRVHRSPAEGRALGRAGHDRVAREFDVRRTVAEYEALYVRQLARRAGGRAAFAEAA
jgi:glycosyltransferase involved in cell wall biosynthesis